MRGKISHKRTAYALALAGISAALALLFVWLGVITRYVTIAFYVVAGLAVAIPLSKGYYLSSIFALVVSVGLSFLVGDIAAVSGYAIYFGPATFISCLLCEKKIKWYITYPVKVIWINGTLAVLYYALQGLDIFSVELVSILPYWAIAIIGTVALLVIDIFILYVYKNLKVVLSKVIRDKDEQKVTEEDLYGEDESDPFEMDDLTKSNEGNEDSSEDFPNNKPE